MATRTKAKKAVKTAKSKVTKATKAMKRPKKVVGRPKKVVAKKGSASKVVRKTEITNNKMVLPKPSKVSAPEKPYTQSEFLASLTKTTGLSKPAIKLVMEQIKAIIEAHIGRNGPGVFALPGLMKMTLKSKPATKARKGINPFTGEEITFKAKPARRVIKIKPLKKLKALV